MLSATLSRLTLSVAMAACNGEKFLEDQLFSIARQTRLPDETPISDDGSTDATMAILERFAWNSPFPVRVYRNRVSLGYRDHFFKAASLCQGDLIAFSDQDDVWLENRLTKSIPILMIMRCCSRCIQVWQLMRKSIPWDSSDLKYL
jgi:glycosyltransferase involved in cell wall biosynthesis